MQKIFFGRYCKIISGADNKLILALLYTTNCPLQVVYFYKGPHLPRSYEQCVFFTHAHNSGLIGTRVTAFEKPQRLRVFFIPHASHRTQKWHSFGGRWVGSGFPLAPPKIKFSAPGCSLLIYVYGTTRSSKENLSIKSHK